MPKTVCVGEPQPGVSVVTGTAVDGGAAPPPDHSTVVDEAWSDLTEAQKAAAKTLGYDKRRWNNNKRVASDDKDWAELSDAEREAATVLGYNQANWDADGSSEA